MPNFIDLTGNVYGELTVKQMLRNYKNSGRTYCMCAGTDGGSYIVRQDALRSGATKYIKGACSAGRADDLSQKRFGRLVALYPTDERAANNSIIWFCKCDCGSYIKVSANNLKRQHTSSCGCKKRSYAERLIVNYLNTQDICFRTEKTFDDLKNPNNTMNLYFDFFFPDLNLVIEYDGESHFHPIAFFGGEKRFNYIRQCDEIKNQYCKDHGFRMVRIPYTKTDEEVIQIVDEVIHP